MSDAGGDSDSGESRPNVLRILIDQHNARALGYAGHQDVETPNLDRLTAEGVAFERAYCPSPVCGLARASLFAGEFPGSPAS